MGNGVAVWGQIVLLGFAYAFGIIILFGNVSITSIVSVYLTNTSPESRIQTVPLTVLIACSALVIPLAGMLFQFFQSYKLVFVLGGTVGIAGTFLSFVSVFWGGPVSGVYQNWSFYVLCLGCALQGLSYGVIHYYRHVAASELAPENAKGWAIGIVLSGGIVAGALGPQIAALTRDIIPHVEYGGTYVVLCGIR